METIKMIHGLIPFPFFIVLLISIVRAGLHKIPNTKKDIFLTLTLIFAHIQLLIGLVLLVKKYYMLGRSSAFLERDITFEYIIRIPELRFDLIAHPLTMIIAVILITFGKGKAKNIADNTKANKTIFWYFTVALMPIIVSKGTLASPNT